MYYLFFSSPVALSERDSELSELYLNFFLADPEEQPLPDKDLLSYLGTLSREDDLGIVLVSTDSDELGQNVTYFILGQTFQLDEIIAENLNWHDPLE